jgi:hypothetical protein
MRKLEAFTALAILALAAGVFFGTRDLTIWEGVSPGPRFMPVLVATVSAIVGLGLLASAVRMPQEAAPEWPHGPALRRVLLSASAILGFVVLAPLLGFVPSVTLLVLFILLAALRRRLVPSLFATAVTVGLIQGVFVSWLHIPLPKGVLGL